MRFRTRLLPVLLVVGLLVLAGCTTGTTGGDVGGTPAVDTTVADATAEPAGEDSRPSADEGDVNGTLELHFIHVGQGDSTLIVGPDGGTILVDTGDFRDDGEYVVDYFRSQGVDHLDALVSTHADADHIGGNAAVIDYLETEGEGVDAVYDPGIAASTATYDRYLDAVERHDVPLYRTQAGDRIPLDGARVDVLGPPEEPLAGGERNENSIVLKLSFGRTSALLTGDAGPEEEPYLVRTHGEALDVTLLKAGHHGSRTSTSAALLDATTPRVVVVSSAYDSRYGHPHEEVLTRLAARAVPTYWTGTHGTVVATSDGDVIEVATQVDASTRARDLRTDAPVDPGTGGGVVVREAYAASESTDESADESAPTVEVTEIHADAAGDDRENLDDEYVVLTNRGESTVDLSGWQLTDESGARYTFPAGATLDAGASVTVYTGAGSDTATERYWDAGRPVWNNGGDTIRLLRPDGRVVTEVSY